MFQVINKPNQMWIKTTTIELTSVSKAIGVIPDRINREELNVPLVIIAFFLKTVLNFGGDRQAQQRKSEFEKLRPRKAD